MWSNAVVLVGSPAVAGRVLENRVCLSFCPSFRPFFCPGVSLELYHYSFVNFDMVLETHIKLCVTKLGFLEKNLLPQNLEKWTKNGLKTGFCEFIERFRR